MVRRVRLTNDKGWLVDNGDGVQFVGANNYIFSYVWEPGSFTAGIPAHFVVDVGQNTPINIISRCHYTYQWNTGSWEEDHIATIELKWNNECDEPTTDGGWGSTGSVCFIATAVTGGPLSPEVELLRGLRDNVLMKTTTGRRMFEEFYREYYKFSPSIVSIIHSNPEFKEALRWSIVDPLINYFRLVIMRPDWKPEDIESIPNHIRDYFLLVNNEMDAWLSRVPLPSNFDLESPEAAAMELAVILKFVLKTPEKKLSYLEKLHQQNIIPFKSISENDRRVINTVLDENGIPTELRNKIVGDY